MADVVVLIGTRKGLWVARSSGDRANWELDPPQLKMEEVAAVGFDPRTATNGGPPRLFAGSTSFVYGTRLLHSDDGGRTFIGHPADAVKFPERTGTTLARIWQIAPGHEDGEVWAGTEPSALFRSVDGGETFTMNDGLWDHPHRESWAPGGGGQAIHTVLPHPTDAGDLMVAMSTGGVYRSGDAGQSWEPRSKGIRADFFPEPLPDHGQCVHKVARNPENPDQLFAQNHGGVFRSDDAGRMWTEISDGLPASFGFPVLTNPHRPGTVYVFPLVADVERFPPSGAMAVWRSTDAGQNWEPLTDGLPQSGFYTAVMRDAACVDDQQRTGIYFGTRSGSVYVGIDDGDHPRFTRIAENLPDVLSIRAATVG
jgi:hypothetical protein